MDLNDQKVSIGGPVQLNTDILLSECVVTKAPRTAKTLEIKFGRKLRNSSQVWQIMMEIINHSAMPRTILQKRVEMTGDSVLGMKVPYETLMNQSTNGLQHDKFLDVNGNLIVKCFIQTCQPEKPNIIYEALCV